MIDPVSDGERLYVRYVFSYNSTLPEAHGARTMFEGMGFVRSLMRIPALATLGLLSIA